MFRHITAKFDEQKIQQKQYYGQSNLDVKIFQIDRHKHKKAKFVNINHYQPLKPQEAIHSGTVII